MVTVLATKPQEPVGQDPAPEECLELPSHMLEDISTGLLCQGKEGAKVPGDRPIECRLIRPVLFE